MLYCAFVSNTATFNPAVHSREDMEVYKAELSGEEGDAAELRLEVLNTRAAFPGRRLFFSRDGVLLFTGHVVSAIGQVGETITVQAVGKPADAGAAQAALCESLKVAPFYDELSLPEGARDDIAEVLSGHSKVLDWDRLTNACAAIDLFLSSTPAVEITPYQDSLGVSFTEPPEGVNVSCVARWSQVVDNSEDLGRHVDGLTTMTAENLVQSWPKKGDQIGDGLFVLDSYLRERTDAAGMPVRERHEVPRLKQAGDFALDPSVEDAEVEYEKSFVSTMEARLKVAHRFEVRRTETASFSLSLPIQADIITGPTEQLDIPIQELKPGVDLTPDWQPDTDYAVGALVEYNGSAWIAAFPHRSQDRFSTLWWRRTGLPARYDIRRLQSFFSSPRGQEFRLHMLERAKDRLRRAGRCVRVSCDAPMPADPNAIHTGARARIYSPALVGGSAVGKIVGYTMTWENGDENLSLEIACAPGLGEADALTIGLAPGGLVLTPALGRVDVTIENRGEDQLQKWFEVRPPIPPKAANEEEVEPPLFSTETLAAETDQPGKVLPTKITFEPIAPRNDFEGTCTLLTSGPFGLPQGFTA